MSFVLNLQENEAQNSDVRSTIISAVSLSVCSASLASVVACIG